MIELFSETGYALHPFEVIGVMGFALYVTNYTLLTLGVLDASCTRYFLLNLLAAVLVLVGLTVSFNLASALIQLFWVVLSLLAIVLRMRGHGRPRRVSRAAERHPALREIS